jgi:predicted phage tail protein
MSQFAFDEQSLFSERSSTISPHPSTESTDALFDITSVEGLPSKSSIGQYSSEIITSDTNINTDVIGSRYDVDTDDVITLTQDTMEIGRDDLKKDSFRTDTVNLAKILPYLYFFEMI